ncbi:MAG TPA: hypothetical protein VGG74_02535 [Kofleriaceae bacterium]
MGISLGVLGALAVTWHAHPVVVVVDSPPPPPAIAARIVHVDATDVTYNGRVVATVQGAMCPDSPCMIVDGLFDALIRDPSRGPMIRLEIADVIPAALVCRLIATIQRAGDDAVVASLSWEDPRL